ncbi:leucine-rich repeat-containing protein [Tanacetum coccineum]
MSSSKLFVIIYFFATFASSISLNNSIHKCSEKQSEALLLFKQNLSSINYTSDDLADACRQNSVAYFPKMMSWNTSIDCCNWNGVSCDYSTGDVIGLDVSCGILKGIIHPNSSLFNLPHLQRLDLAFNDFSGSQIPREIGRFSNSLIHLRLFGCSFSGQVPPDITLLHKLVSLDLSSYDVDLKLEPHVFINMLQNYTNLEDLEGVIISSVLPTSLNISSSLKFLSLFNTGMKGKLPHYIFNLHSLELLNLGGNSFTGDLLPEISFNLTHLAFLDLMMNKLNGTLPSWLFTSPSLQSIFLYDNMFSGTLACLKIQPEIIKDLELMEVELVVRGSEGYIASIKIEHNLILRIKEAQKEDGELWSVVQNMKNGKQEEFRVDEHGVIWYGNRLCVPDDFSLREAILTEAHSSPFSIHPGSTKMYRDLKQNFWWNGMKQEVARFVAKKGLKRQKRSKTDKETKETRTRVKKQPEIKSRISPTQQEGKSKVKIMKLGTNYDKFLKFQSLLKDLQILNEIQPLKQETSNQIQKDQEEKSTVELLAEEKLQKANQALNESQSPQEMRIQDLEIQKQQCLEEMKNWMNDLGIREYQKEEIDFDYRRKCEDKIYELKDKFNSLSIEIQKITQEAKELRESEARARSQKIIIDDDDDDLGFYAVHPNTIYTPVSQNVELKDSLIMGDGHINTTPETDVYSVEPLFKPKLAHLTPISPEIVEVCVDDDDNDDDDDDYDDDFYDCVDIEEDGGEIDFDIFLRSITFIFGRNKEADVPSFSDNSILRGIESDRDSGEDTISIDDLPLDDSMIFSEYETFTFDDEPVMAEVNAFDEINTSELSYPGIGENDVLDEEEDTFTFTIRHYTICPPI